MKEKGMETLWMGGGSPHSFEWWGLKRNHEKNKKWFLRGNNKGGPGITAHRELKDRGEVK